MSDTPNLKAIQRALEGCLEALVRHQGLMATDRPDLWDRSLAWTIDEAERIAAAQRALSAPPDQEKHRP